MRFPPVALPRAAQLSFKTVDELRIMAIEILDCTFTTTTGYLMLDELRVCSIRK
jgi:hypothetical protein